MKLTIFFAISLIIGLILMGIMHEQVHKTIYEDYNIKSKIDYFNWEGSFITRAEKPCPNDYCHLANSINEAIRYHLVAFYLLIGIGLFLIINLLEEKKMGDKNFR